MDSRRRTGDEKWSARTRGVAEVRRREVAAGGAGGRYDLGGKRALGWAAQHPYGTALCGEIAGQLGEIGDRPALACAHGAGRQGDHRPAISGQPSRGAPFLSLLHRHVKFGFRPFRGKGRAPRQRQRATAIDLAAAQYDLPMGALPDSWKTGMDLRTLNWKKNIEAYRWAFQELNESLSREAIAVLDPAATGLRDYLVEFKIPILWMSGPQDSRSLAASFDEEKAFAREILMKWPTNIPVFGWPDNGQWAERGIGDNAHQPNVPTTIDHAHAPCGDGPAQVAGRITIDRIIPRTGPTKHRDP